MCAEVSPITAAVLHGPKDVRIERVRRPGEPARGEAVICVGCVGVCGSDLHMYEDGRIGETIIETPAILGHEFGGVVEQIGENARDGNGKPLPIGSRVAVDPAIPCHDCELCHTGHPNLCPHHVFMGVWPTQGALCQCMAVPARCCFPLPATIPDEHAPLLETLGIALHAVDLAHIRVGASVAVIGAGAVGLCITQVLQLAGASPVFVTDRLPWRLEAAAALGAQPVHIDDADPIEAVMRATNERGVDVAIEAAWSDASSLTQAVEVVRPGGRLVVVGISGDDTLNLRHSVARRKGLTIAMCRRMKRTYPRAIALAAQGRVNLASLITHRYPLQQAKDALDHALAYRDGVIKIIVRCQ